MPDHQTTTFDVALRGYDREQVDQHLVEVRSDFDSVLSERDELAVRVRQLQQRLEDLHLSTADEEPADELPVSSLTGFGARVEKILRLAEDEATALREETRHDVEQERADAQKQLSAIREATEKEAGAHRRKVEQEAAGMLDRTRQEAARLRAEAEAHAAATREEASGHLEAVRARAAQAAADFETALAKRRQKAGAEADRTRRESERDLAALAKRRDAITEQLRNVREMLSTLTGGVVPASESDGAAELDAEVPAPRSRSGRAAVGDGAQG